MRHMSRNELQIVGIRFAGQQYPNQLHWATRAVSTLGIRMLGASSRATQWETEEMHNEGRRSVVGYTLQCAAGAHAPNTWPACHLPGINIVTPVVLDCNLSHVIV